MIIELLNFSFFSISGWGIDLDYCDIECFALETNRDHAVIFEIESKYCISDSFVDHEGSSTFPTVLTLLTKVLGPTIDFPTWDPAKTLRTHRESVFGGQWYLITELSQDWGNRF